MEIKELNKQFRASDYYFLITDDFDASGGQYFNSNGTINLQKCKYFSVSKVFFIGHVYNTSSSLMVLASVSYALSFNMQNHPLTNDKFMIETGKSYGNTLQFASFQSDVIFYEPVNLVFPYSSTITYSYMVSISASAANYELICNWGLYGKYWE